MEIFLVSRRARFRVFLNEENLEEIEAKNEVKSRRLAERKRPTKEFYDNRASLARVLCACIYIYKYRFNLFSTRFSLSFFPSLSLSRLSSFIARYRVKRL